MFAWLDKTSLTSDSVASFTFKKISKQMVKYKWLLCWIYGQVAVYCIEYKYN